MKRILKGIAIASVAGVVLITSVAPASAHSVSLSNRTTGPHSRNINRVSVQHDFDFSRYQHQSSDWQRRYWRNYRNYLRNLDRRFDRVDFDRFDQRRLRDLEDLFRRSMRHDRQSLRHDLDLFFREDTSIRNDIDIDASTGGFTISRTTRVGDISSGDIDVRIDVSN